jgi:general secretion pathway protein L
MANTLYILLPSKAAAHDAPDWATLVRPFALVSAEGKILQQGSETLSALKQFAVNANQVALLLAASDVSLISIKVPPMSHAKLKLALPNLIEDQLLGDPADAILLASPVEQGVTTVAVVEKVWMQTVYQKALVLGARKLSAFATSLALKPFAHAAVALVDESDLSLELAICSIDKSARGVSIKRHAVSAESDAASTKAIESAELQELMQLLDLLVPEGDIQLAVPRSRLEAYQHELATKPDLAARVNIHAAEWAARIAGLGTHSLDLMVPITHQNQTSFNWSRWRWPLRLSVVTLLIWIVGVNIETWDLKREASALRSSLTSTYRQSFPKETTIVNPLVQMQQKIAQSKKVAGQSVPDDFLVLAAQFAQVWDRTVTSGQPEAAVVSVEYRAQSLFVKVKSIALIPIEPLRAALKEQSMVLVSTNDGALQIRAKKGDEK